MIDSESLSHVRLFANAWTVAGQAPLSVGFPRQEYWSGVPLPSPIYIYNYDSFVLMYGRDHHNIVENYPPIKHYILAYISEKAMAPHSSTLAWKIPWMAELHRLQSMGSLRVGHDWVTSLSLFTFMHWRRKWQPTPVFLPGESQGRGSLEGCRLWGRTESDTTEVT